MSVRKKSKNDDIIMRTRPLNRSIRVRDRKRRVHDQIHVGLQERLEKEMKIRDGVTRLMAACTHETQLLEAAKTLQTSNARTFAYMSELQRIKATEVMEAITDDTDRSCEESRVCKGRIAISDIRIPLVWKDVFPSGKSKDQSKHAVFCLLSIGSEVQDTELDCVDRTTTDISFSDAVVFENASYDFKLVVEVFAYPMSSVGVSAPTPQKLRSRINRSIGKGEGKKIRERLKENASNGTKTGPQYEKIGSLVLTLGDVSDAVRSYDLDRTNQHHLSLPLYESITCRLVGQPKCITDIAMSGFLHVLHMVGAVPNWSYMWCEVKAGLLKGWKDPKDSRKTPLISVDIVPKDVRINEIDKIRQKRPHSFQVRDTLERNIFAAEDKDAMVKWIRCLRQHKSDHGAWSIVCSIDSANRKPMFIASPSPKLVQSELIFDRGIRKTLVYDQLGVDSPLKAMSEAIRCTDLLNDRNAVSGGIVKESVQSALLGNQATAPWANFFTGSADKSVKVTKKTDIHSGVLPNQRDAALKPLENDTRTPDKAKKLRVGATHLRQVTEPCRSEASGSDDAFLTDSDDNVTRRRSQRLEAMKKATGPSALRKKRRAPTIPAGNQSNSPNCNPPPKPPLPKLPPKMKSYRREMLSSGSSFDSILDENKTRASKDCSSSKSQSYESSENIYSVIPMSGELTKSDDATSAESLRTDRCSQSSGYKSETDSTSWRMGERSWAKRQNFVIPSSVTPSGDENFPLHGFERCKSLDTDRFQNATRSTAESSGSCLLPPSTGEVIYTEPEECRPRTNTIPQSSPSRLRARLTSQPTSFGIRGLKQPTPTPRRSYLTAVESSKTNPSKNHIYETPYIACNNGNALKFACDRSASDPNFNLCRQTAPPPLPPKTKSAQKPNQTEEPIYATVDKEKKALDRAMRNDGYVKAHRAIITLCKQRMEEEGGKVHENNSNFSDPVHGEV